MYLLSIFERLFNPTKASGVDRSDLIQRKFHSLGSWRFSKVNLNNKKAFMNEISRDADVFRNLGEEDGKTGIDLELIKRISDKVARLWQSFIQSTFLKKVKENEVELVDKKIFYNYHQKKHAALEDQKKVMDVHYEFNPRKYNFWLGILYLAVALLLVLADFPLTSQIAINGFQLEGNILGIGNDVDMDANFFAIGLVLMTFYIKVIYDEYMGNTIQNSLLKARKSNLAGRMEPATDEEVKKVKSRKNIKLIVKLIILVLLVVTLYILGKFRFNYMFEDVDTEDADYMTYYSVLLTGLILPIISGVMASIGVSLIWNIWLRFIIKLRLFFSKKLNSIALIRVVNCEGKLAEYKSHLDWADNTNNFVLDQSTFFFESYQRGFNKGVQESTSADQFDYAMSLRKKKNAQEEIKTYQIVN